MVIDSSALLAVLFNEPEAAAMADAISADPRRLASAFSLLEAAVVVEARKGKTGGRELDLLLRRMELEAIPLTSSLVEIARDAWRKFGRGQHKASLNIGDCCSYAVARLSGEPLLFKGTDFTMTDVTIAAY